MDFQNPTSSKLKTTLTMFGGMVLGAMVSEGVIGVIHKPNTSADPAAIKKDNTMLLVKRGAIAGGSAYGAAAIKGEDTTSTVVRGMLYGMAGQQTVKIVTHVVKSNDKIATTVSKSKFAANATGLACACTQPLPTLNRAVRVRALRNPAYVNTGLNGNIFENAINKNAMLANAS